LLPAMVWHFAVDAVAGVAGPKYLLPSQDLRVEAIKDNSVGI
jgi:hypothetical protein